MKILIDNYSQSIEKDNLCEAMSSYLQEAGHDVYLNNYGITIYQKMQQFQPDYYITSSSLLFEDFWDYVESEKTKVIFVIFYDQRAKQSDLMNIEHRLLKSKVKYKLVLNNNFGSHGYIVNEPKNIINFGGFQTDYLVANQHTKWAKQFDFLLLCQNNTVDLKVLKRLFDQKFKFHAHQTGAMVAISMTEQLINYKDILCNYKNFVFYSNKNHGLNKEFYDICALRKPVYVLENQCEKVTKKSIGLDLDITFENRDKSNINFEEFHDHIAKEFSVQNQVDKLLTHLPKVK